MRDKWVKFFKVQGPLCYFKLARRFADAGLPLSFKKSWARIRQGDVARANDILKQLIEAKEVELKK